jgi:parvulin-like peptidyl-prolyl isomerase
MKKLVFQAAILLILCGVAAGSTFAQKAAVPSSGPKVLEEIAAKVNSDIILKSDIEKAETDLRHDLSNPERALPAAQQEQLFNEHKGDILRNLIDESLLLQIAKEQGLSAELDVAKAMEQLRQERNFPTLEALEAEIIKSGITVEEFKDGIRKKSLGDQVIGHEVTSRITITTEEIRGYYDAHQKDFDRPEGIRLQEITVFTDKRSPEEVEAQKKKIDDAVAAIKKGDDFAEVARKFSEDENAMNGGEFGFFEKGKMNKELEDVLWKLSKGQTTDVIKVQDGLMVFKIADKHNGGILSFDLAQDDIKQAIFQERAPPKVREYLTRLRRSGYVKVTDGYVDSGAVDKADKDKQDKVSESAEKK